jgi:FAD synthetase
MNMQRLQSEPAAEKVVMVFGVFDGLHDGHFSFLNQARALGTRLVAVVAQDECVMRLKKHYPRSPLSERMEALSNSGLVHAVTPGDQTEGGWEVILKHRPDIVALGYDQHAMREHLALALSSFRFACDLVVLKPHKPDECHCSLMN